MEPGKMMDAMKYKPLDQITKRSNPNDKRKAADEKKKHNYIK